MPQVVRGATCHDAAVTQGTGGFAADEEQAWRRPTPYEADLIDKLLDNDFGGRDELRMQWRSALVRTVSPSGSFAIRPSAGEPPSPAKFGVPVEGESPDEEGGGVHALLHIRDGYLEELEVYRDMPGPIRNPVDPHAMEVFAPPFRWP